MIVAPHRIDPPLIMFSVLPLALFTFKLVKLAHLYAARVGANIRQTLAAALAGLALSHTIGVAVVKGAVHAQPAVLPHAEEQAAARARRRIRRRAHRRRLMLIAMLLAAVGLTRQIALGPHLLVGIPEELKGPDVSVWVAVLLIQAVPYAAAVLVSLVSALSLPARWLGPAGRCSRAEARPTASPSRAARPCSPRARRSTGPCRSPSASCRRAASRSPA